MLNITRNNFGKWSEKAAKFFEKLLDANISKIRILEHHFQQLHCMVLRLHFFEHLLWKDIYTELRNSYGILQPFSNSIKSTLFISLIKIWSKFTKHWKDGPTGKLWLKMYKPLSSWLFCSAFFVVNAVLNLAFL